MKHLVLTIVVLFVPVITLFAQTPKEVVIKLNSGVEVRGFVVEDIPGEHISIKTIEGDIFIYRASEISRIENPNERIEKAQQKQDLKLEAKARRAERQLGNFKGYRGVLEFGVASDGVTPQLMAAFINGFNISPYFYLGVGIGFHNAPETKVDYPYKYKVSRAPIFLNLRSSFLKDRRVTPYVSGNIGYSIGLNKAVDVEYIYNEWADRRVINRYVLVNTSIFYAEFSLGVEFRIKRKTALFVAANIPMMFNTKYPIALGGKIGFSF